MRNRSLAADHMRRASAGLLALDVLVGSESWADVVSESLEVVELSAMVATMRLPPPHRLARPSMASAPRPC